MNMLDDEFYENLNRFSYRKKTTEDIQQIKEIFNQISNHIIPNKYPKYMIGDICSELRHKTIERIGFSLINKEWIKLLAKWIDNKRCLEVMAGCGSLSYALKQENTNIIATDNFTWKGGGDWNTDKNYWTNIQDIDAIEAVKKYGKDIDIIICSWAYMDDTLYRVLQTMRKINPNCVMIYIGEGWGGCTADNNFFDNMTEIKDKEIDYINLYYQRWDGIHDGIYLVK